MPILYDNLLGSKTPEGTWTKISGPVLPEAPTTYNGNVDFTDAPVGVHVFQYTVGDKDACEDTATVTYEVKRRLPLSNDDCDNAKVIAVPFGNVFPLPPIDYIMTNEWISCSPSAISSEIYCEREGATLSTQPWSPTTFVECDSWYKIYIPPFASINFGMTVTVSGSAYGGSGLRYPTMALYGMSEGGNCEGDMLLLLQESATSTTNTSSLTVYVNYGQFTAVYLKVGANSQDGGFFSIQVQI